MRETRGMTDAIPTPHLTLNDGNRIPQLGLGVFLVEPDEAERIVSDAFEVGYRHIDTARIYKNEEGVGRAIASSGLSRDELYITTKLWNSDQGADTARPALESSLERLGLDYVDLYLIHWPAPKYGKHVESWEALVALKEAGLAKSIGVSNFMQSHLEDIDKATGVVPVVNQIELHPAFQQRELRSFQEPRGTLTEAWGPLGQGKYELAELAGLAEIAERHGKSVQQVAIRWHIQEGIIVFPKTTKRERMVENADVFDFELSADEMATIAAVDQGLRVGAHPENTDF
ncbi:2,5-diketo-D-gluconate reductase A [Microcella putealis]|uniref:2,5-diketo-D-gluconate reductase A n=2 Tax=Microcella putealis TaxID=337005 RepID=A0A4Q7LZ95_9MICO|nr:2,5-diketo-D-gluconate reductase A [Microcella putealis]TQM26765.1 2,5-diketo-D-gluconate reductase A [Microcella putealis]